jgi:hypothetical protein
MLDRTVGRSERASTVNSTWRWSTQNWREMHIILHRHSTADSRSRGSPDMPPLVLLVLVLRTTSTTAGAKAPMKVF